MVIDLVHEDALERMPEPMVCSLLGVDLPLMRLNAKSASAAAKVRLAVEAAHHKPSLTVAAL